MSDQTKRALIYSHDTFGLGNIRRMVSVAESMVAADKSMNVLIATGSPMLHAFRLSERIDYIKLPCLRRDVTGSYSVKSLNSSWDEVIAMRSRLLLNVVEYFNPNIIIVDKKPLGVANELKLALDHVQSFNQRPHLYLILRDILDSPEKTIPVWDKNRYHSAIDRYYDRILVVGQRDLFDLRRSYEFPKSTCDKMIYCGFLNKSFTPPDALRSKTGKPTLLVTVGGGEDGQSIIATAIDAIKSLSRPRAFRTQIVLGPEMAPKDRTAFLEQQDEDLECFSFVSNLPAMMQSAALVISMAGYNTVCELLSLRKQAILIPRETPVIEQLLRARCLSARGIFDCMEHKEMNSATLLRLIKQRLEPDPSKVVDSRNEDKFRQIRLNGLDVINKILIQDTEKYRHHRLDRQSEARKISAL